MKTFFGSARKLLRELKLLEKLPGCAPFVSRWIRTWVSLLRLRNLVTHRYGESFIEILMQSFCFT